MSDSISIYIPLLNEDVDVWRPAKGIDLGNNTYQVVAIDGYDPSLEEWKFPPGSIVECAFEVQSGDFGKNEKILVAKRIVNKS